MNHHRSSLIDKQQQEEKQIRNIAKENYEIQLPATQDFNNNSFNPKHNKIDSEQGPNQNTRNRDEGVELGSQREEEIQNKIKSIQGTLARLKNNGINTNTNSTQHKNDVFAQNKHSGMSLQEQNNQHFENYNNVPQLKQFKTIKGRSTQAQSTDKRKQKIDSSDQFSLVHTEGYNPVFHQTSQALKSTNTRNTSRGTKPQYDKQFSTLDSIQNYGSMTQKSRDRAPRNGTQYKSMIGLPPKINQLQQYQTESSQNLYYAPDTLDHDSPKINKYSTISKKITQMPIVEDLDSSNYIQPNNQENRTLGKTLMNYPQQQQQYQTSHHRNQFPREISKSRNFSKSQTKKIESDVSKHDYQYSEDIASLLEYEKKRSSRLEYKMKKRDKQIAQLKELRSQLTGEIMHANNSNQNLLKQIGDQKGYFEKHISQITKHLRELEADNEGLSRELKILSSTYKDENINNNQQMRKYQEQIFALENQIKHLNDKIKFQKQVDKDNEYNLQQLLEEKEKRFQQEISKSKVNTNQLIEENLRDKDLIQRMGKELREKDKHNISLQNKIEEQEKAIVDIEDQVLQYQSTQETFSNKTSKGNKTGDIDHQESSEIYAYKRLLSDLMQVCQLQNYSQMVPFIQDMLRNNKTLNQFLNKMRGLMIDWGDLHQHKHSSSSSRVNQVSPKNIWKWIKSLVKQFSDIQHKSEQPQQFQNKTSLLYKDLYLQDKTQQKHQKQKLGFKSSERGRHYELETDGKIGVVGGTNTMPTFDSQLHLQGGGSPDRLLSSIRDQLSNVKLDDGPSMHRYDSLKSINAGGDINTIERKIEKLKTENQFKDHILDKVREHFNIDQNAALIDIEIFLTKLSQKRNAESARLYNTNQKAK